jgi:predicted AlkP superfamily phosphohydrolase/phosphomutase
MKSDHPDFPLLVFAFDSGDPRLLHRWAEEGHLPTIASLMNKGCWAQTTGGELLLEHGAWLSIFSGISRGEHGYYYFRQLVPGSYDLRLVYGREINAPPFWASCRDRRKRIVIIDAVDCALVPGMAGAQLANWAIHRGYVSHAAADQPASEPTNLLGNIRRVFGTVRQIIEDPNANDARNRRFRTDLLVRVDKKGAVARHLIAREKPNLLVISFGESHTAGHQFWRYCCEGSAHRPGDGEEFRFALRDIYQAIDRQLALLLSDMPAATNVVVLSSIGLADHYPTGELLTAFCRNLGYQASPLPSDRNNSLRPAALIRRMIPEDIRRALSRQLSRETREQLFNAQFRHSADWTKTTAFAIPSIYSGFLRINLRGREPQGTVERGAAYDRLLDQLEADLQLLIDPVTREPAIEQTVRASELYGSKYPSALPDLIVHWKPAPHFLSRVVHPGAELTQKKPEFFRDSEHTFRGFFAAAGPSIVERGRISDVDVLDIAPTLLKLLDAEKPPQMTGRPVEQLFCS